ncbi:DUF4880 domain-containing protein [Methylobacterium sp. E-016]|uniref:DUF4880 domain-containing protein n=1 Tax=Methylobacterium sp. E-016 TaxID=2836556 RepID=UPI001FB9B9CD|nr:DUF4880 domain-containing protein [Methylobacterium sp. E-016]MCJ2074993.1 DUF4880 domain-containing protein [Methylobacterium sp. E-016]
MTAATMLDDPRAEAAIAWMVEINSGEMSEKAYREFEAWLQADQRNESVWIRLQESLLPCGVAARQGLVRGSVTKRLMQRRQSRRTVLASLAGVFGIGTAGLALTDRFLPLNHILADQVTLTAQQKRLTLVDGSELVLSPRTAVDLQYEPGLRAMRLLDGKVLMRIAARSVPFHAQVEDVTLNTEAGTFLVERREGVLTLSGLEGAARVGRGGAGDGLSRGEQIEFAGGRVRRRAFDIESATAWLDGLLVAKDRPLGSIVDGIRPYFPGVIRLDPAVTSLHATGVFSLVNPSDTLDALAESLGLSINRIAGYWVTLRPRDS